MSKASIYYGGILEDHAAQEQVVSFVATFLELKRVAAKRVAPHPGVVRCLDRSRGTTRVYDEPFGYYGIIPNADSELIEREQFVFDRRTGELVSLVFDAVPDPRAPGSAVLPATHAVTTTGRHPDLVREADGELLRYGLAFSPVELALLLHVLKLRYWPTLEYCDDPGRTRIVDDVDARASEPELSACLANESLNFATCLRLFMSPDERRLQELGVVPALPAEPNGQVHAMRREPSRLTAPGRTRRAGARGKLRVVTPELSELLGSPISALPVAPSTRLALRAVGVLRVQQLLGMSEAKLRVLPGVGRREARDVAVALADTGLLSLDGEEA